MACHFFQTMQVASELWIYLPINSGAKDAQGLEPTGNTAPVCRGATEDALIQLLLRFPQHVQFPVEYIRTEESEVTARVLRARVAGLVVAGRLIYCSA